MANQSEWIVDVTTATFEEAIVKASEQRAVVIDFWAPWCGPCRQLGPILEKLAGEYNGRFLLAKLNVDECPEIAGAFGVQSIPLVVAFRNGQPVNQFMGVLPEEEIRSWLETFLPSPAQELLQAGKELEADDPQSAEVKYREAAHLEPENDSIKIALAGVLLAQERDDECGKLIAELESRGFLEPEAERIKSQLELREVAEEAGGVEEARKAAAAEPDNLALQLQLADALAVAKKHEEALEICLRLIQRDRAGVGEEAKETMVKIFDMLGPGSELTSTYRRRLATALH